MPSLPHDLAATLRTEGPHRFASWDGGLFDALVAGPAQTLSRQLDGQSDADAVTVAYLRLLQQGVGTGAIRQAPSSGAWANFLERCLVQLVPELLPGVPAGQRLPLLTQAWNLGEGLGREPAWLDRYVTACAGQLQRLGDLEEFLVRTLEPVLTPARPATWKGPFRLTVFDLRPLHEDFLPGEIRLAAPMVLGMQDRRQPELQAGILMRPGGESQLLGLTPGLGEYRENAALPALTFTDQRLEVAGQAVELPAMRRPYRCAVAAAGYVAVAAVDSQRLWVVESRT